MRFKLILRCICAASSVCWAAASYAQDVMYRYINDKGTTVIDYSVPAKYVANGYEILNKNGQVVEVISPAPSANEIAARDAENQLRKEFAILKRRYSGVDDIKNVMKRKLTGINTNIAIVESNIVSIKNSLNAAVEEAASYERSGRKIPKNLLQRLDDSRTQLKVAEELLVIRKDEYIETEKKYGADIQKFHEGLALDKADTPRTAADVFSDK